LKRKKPTIYCGFSPSGTHRNFVESIFMSPITRRKVRVVSILTLILAAGALGLMLGCPPPQVRAQVPQYQEIGIIQMEKEFVPSEVVLVKGKAARLHVTNGFEKEGLTFVIDSLAIKQGLLAGQVLPIEVSREQLLDLNGRKYGCAETNNVGYFSIVDPDASGPVQTKLTNGAVEIAIVMTNDLAAPHEIVVKKGVPVRLFVTKTKGGDVEAEKFRIEGWGIDKDMMAGDVEVIDYTPDKVGKFEFLGISTPNSKGTIQVVE
jgi:plastocyanin domain-containing protein